MGQQNEQSRQEFLNERKEVMPNPVKYECDDCGAPLPTDFPEEGLLVIGGCKECKTDGQRNGESGGEDETVA
jgi:hypothetical protein